MKSEREMSDLAEVRIQYERPSCQAFEAGKEIRRRDIIGREPMSTRKRVTYRRGREIWVVRLCGIEGRYSRVIFSRIPGFAF